MVTLRIKSKEDIHATLVGGYIRCDNDELLFFNQNMSNHCKKYITVTEKHIRNSLCQNYSSDVIYTREYCWHCKWIKNALFKHATRFEVIYFVNMLE